MQNSIASSDNTQPIVNSSLGKIKEGDITQFIAAKGLGGRVIVAAKLFMQGKGVVTTDKVEGLLSKLNPQQLRNLNRDIHNILREVGVQSEKPPSTIEKARLKARNIYLNNFEVKVNDELKNKADKSLEDLAKLDDKAFLQHEKVKSFLSQLIKQTPWFKENHLHSQTKYQSDARFTGEHQDLHKNLIDQLDELIRKDPSIVELHKDSDKDTLTVATLKLNEVGLSKPLQDQLRQVVGKMIINKETSQLTFNMSVKFFGNKEEKPLITDEKFTDEGGVHKRKVESHMVATGARSPDAPIRRKHKQLVAKSESEVELAKAIKKLESGTPKTSNKDQGGISVRDSAQRLQNEQSLVQNVIVQALDIRVVAEKQGGKDLSLLQLQTLLKRDVPESFVTKVNTVLKNIKGRPSQIVALSRLLFDAESQRSAITGLQVKELLKIVDSDSSPLKNWSKVFAGKIEHVAFSLTPQATINELSPNQDLESILYLGDDQNLRKELSSLVDSFLMGFSQEEKNRLKPELEALGEVMIVDIRQQLKNANMITVALIAQKAAANDKKPSELSGFLELPQAANDLAGIAKNLTSNKYLTKAREQYVTDSIPISDSNKARLYLNTLLNALLTEVPETSPPPPQSKESRILENEKKIVELKAQIAVFKKEKNMSEGVKLQKQYLKLINENLQLRSK
jgi:hypothetical protein